MWAAPRPSTYTDEPRAVDRHRQAAGRRAGAGVRARAEGRRRQRAGRGRGVRPGATTAATTRPCTRSPARTWTGGSASWAARCPTAPSARTSPPTGLDVSGALIGERWRIGAELVLEVTCGRIPCRTFQGHLGEQRLGQALHAAGRARCVSAGDRAGRDPRRATRSRSSTGPDHDVTVALAFRAIDHRARAAAAAAGGGRRAASGGAGDRRGSTWQKYGREPVRSAWRDGHAARCPGAARPLVAVERTAHSPGH